MTNNNHAPSFQIARLFRKTSEKGNTYFVGRLGGARVTLLKSRDVAEDGGEIWSLMIAEAPQTKRQPGTNDDTVRDYQRPVSADRPAGQHETECRPTFDGEIPF